MTLASEPDPKTGQPIGLKVDATPSMLPENIALEGRFGRVERFDVARHAASLWSAVKGNDDIWTYLFVGPFADQASFAQMMAAHGGGADPYYYFAILDPAGDVLGAAALMSARPKMRVIEIGGIFYGPQLKRSALATEAQYLLARYAFETLGYRRYEWKCNALNAPSRRAAERLGFTFEGIFRSHIIAKGRNRDTAWFSMLDTEWPARKRSFERWLAPANFDPSGEQRATLEACAVKP